MRLLARFEFGVVRVQLPVLRKKVETLEIVSGAASVRRFRKTQASPFAYDLHHRRRFGIEEVLQRDDENESDAQHSRQSRMHQSAFSLGQERRRETGVLAQFAQSHALAQPQTAEFLADRIPLQALFDRL